jgi:hypothetical protein
MPYVKRNWKDEIVQFPSRYKLKRTTDGIVIETYDLERVTGTVTESDQIVASKLNNMEDGISKSARTDEPNNFTGNQTLVDGDFIHVSTSGTANKRRFSKRIFGTSWYVSALNDAGAVIRNLIEFIHDGAVRVFGSLSIQDGRIHQMNAHSGTANKRWFSWAIDTAQNSLVLQAFNDVGGYVRQIIEFFHDGGVKIYGLLTVTGQIVQDNANGIVGRTTGGLAKEILVLTANNKTIVGDPSIPTVIRGSSVTNKDGHKLSLDTGWKTTTLVRASWIAGNAGSGLDASHHYILGDGDYTVGDTVDFMVGYGSFFADLAVAENAGMYNSILAGGDFNMYFFVRSLPDTDLRLKYRINKG